MRFQETIGHRLTGRLKKSFDLVGSMKDKTILDIGCSFGWFERFAVENGCKEVIGIDVEEKNLLNANSQINDRRAKFLKGSALNLFMFEESHFDIVVMWETLEHLPKNTERQAFREIERVLRPGGSLYFSVPNKSFWSCVLDPAWYFGHRHYSMEELDKLLEQSCFKIRKQLISGGIYELFALILLYIFKWFFGREVPYKVWFEKKRRNEYLDKNKKGFVTIFSKVQRLLDK